MSFFSNLKSLTRNRDLAPAVRRCPGWLPTGWPLLPSAVAAVPTATTATALPGAAPPLPPRARVATGAAPPAALAAAARWPRPPRPPSRPPTGPPLPHRPPPAAPGRSLLPSPSLPHPPLALGGGASPFLPVGAAVPRFFLLRGAVVVGDWSPRAPAAGRWRRRVVRAEVGEWGGWGGVRRTRPPRVRWAGAWRLGGGGRWWGRGSRR